ncbi:MAG: hypothetical protein ABUL55_01650 [Pseudomonadota bacterium]
MTLYRGALVWLLRAGAVIGFLYESAILVSSGQYSLMGLAIAEYLGVFLVKLASAEALALSVRRTSSPSRNFPEPMTGYPRVLAWILRAIAAADLIYVLPYALGNFSPGITAQPYGSNAVSSLNSIMQPLFMASAAEILMLLSGERSQGNT